MASTAAIRSRTLTSAMLQLDSNTLQQLIFFRASRQYFAEHTRVNKPVNSVPSFEVSSIFTSMKIEDIFLMENLNQYAV